MPIFAFLHLKWSGQFQFCGRPLWPHFLGQVKATDAMLAGLHLSNCIYPVKGYRHTLSQFPSTPGYNAAYTRTHANTHAFAIPFSERAMIVLCFKLSNYLISLCRMDGFNRAIIHGSHAGQRRQTVIVFGQQIFVRCQKDVNFTKIVCLMMSSSVTGCNAIGWL